MIRLSTSAVTGLSLSKFLGFNSMAKAKYVYTWGDGKADGDGSMKALLGGKGANLAEMTRINLPVPPGFTITTEVCTYYYANKKSYPKELQAQMEAGIKNMEKIMGCKFGDAKGMPLLVAVRSGARDSMPAIAGIQEGFAEELLEDFRTGADSDIFGRDWNGELPLQKSSGRVTELGESRRRAVMRLIVINRLKSGLDR
jgi:hypothetical protein